MRRTLLLAAALLFTACSDPAAPDDRWADPEKISYHPSLEIDLASMTRSTTGLYYLDLTAAGVPGRLAKLDPPDVVRVHLEGWLPDGTKIEDTTNDLPIGPQSVLLFVPGLAEGISGMREGGRRKLVIPPDLAWPKGRGPIPPRTTLIYRVQLMWVQP